MTAGLLRRWRLPLVLAGICTVLAGLLVWQVSTPMPRLDKGPATEQAGQPRDAAGGDATADGDSAAAMDGDGGSEQAEAASDADSGFSLPPLADFSAIVERPLFNRTRRPALAIGDDAGALTSSEGKSPLLLSGVMVAGRRRIALLQTRASPKTIRAEEGETIEGWKVVTIRPLGVTVSNGSSKEDLTLPDRIISPDALVQTPPPGQPGAPNRPGTPGAPPRPAPGQPSEHSPGDVDMEQQ